MSRLVTTSVYLDEVQLTRLREVSSELRRPMAGIIREAIDGWLSELERARVDRDLAPARRTALARDEGQEQGLLDSSAERAPNVHAD